ncbi:2'-5' RNA ligase family protein [Kutzneria sp. CA-103260]|uniref:2'-5' RNA ligase family protein n=1 Tax=Kutzneria sp. CA-103260 TaxID=2802641 RepID=UPI001BA5E51C|nr:2'-5' RNA ligase family protein [Kutzneria sp. CA-103260]QUQ71617.1 2'-5' RNA ligase [Kutzneria sp. CA-103260]
MRLFTALVPDAAATEHLAAALATVDGPTWTPQHLWHITLCFHGDGDDPVARAAWLRERAAGLSPIRLRLASAGTFGDVLWIGVEADEALTAAAAAVRGHAPGHVERHDFIPHLTVAWGRDKSIDAVPLLGYKGPWWTSSELVLMGSERTPNGYRYPALDAVLLRGPP